MEKIYEERFQQLLEGFRHRVDMYDSMVENCDKRIDVIDDQIAALKKMREDINRERYELEYPHYLSHLLPQVMELVNEVVAERGYQFEVGYYRSFGLSSETLVCQDYAKSEKETSAMFEFRPYGDKGFQLKVKRGEYANEVSIAALNDFKATTIPVLSLQTLLDHIDECELKYPPKQMTEAEVIEQLRSDKEFRFEYTPQSVWTYQTITEAMRAAINRDRYFEESERIPSTMVDKDMFLLGMKCDARFYDLLPQDKLEELGAYDEEFLSEQIRRRSVSVDKIPAEKITVSVLKSIIPNAGYCNAISWAEIFSHLIDQEIADLLIEETVDTMQYIPEQFRTFEMCQRAYKTDMREFIPKKFLTEKGRMKRNP